MTMAERMARAHYAKMRELVPATRAPFPSWDDLSDNTRNMQIECARAVLDAMREPSVPMIAAAWGEPADVSHIWRTMIDAALKD
jgi:hypothetical protein